HTGTSVVLMSAATKYVPSPSAPHAAIGKRVRASSSSPSEKTLVAYSWNIASSSAPGRRTNETSLPKPQSAGGCKRAPPALAAPPSTNARTRGGIDARSTFNAAAIEAAGDERAARAGFDLERGECDFGSNGDFDDADFDFDADFDSDFDFDFDFDDADF